MPQDKSKLLFSDRGHFMQRIKQTLGDSFSTLNFGSGREFELTALVLQSAANKSKSSQRMKADANFKQLNPQLQSNVLTILEILEQPEQYLNAQHIRRNLAQFEISVTHRALRSDKRLLDAAKRALATHVKDIILERAQHFESLPNQERRKLIDDSANRRLAATNARASLSQHQERARNSQSQTYSHALTRLIGDEAAFTAWIEHLKTMPEVTDVYNDNGKIALTYCNELNQHWTVTLDASDRGETEEAGDTLLVLAKNRDELVLDRALPEKRLAEESLVGFGALELTDNFHRGRPDKIFMLTKKLIDIGTLNGLVEGYMATYDKPRIIGDYLIFRATQLSSIHEIKGLVKNFDASEFEADSDESSDNSDESMTTTESVLSSDDDDNEIAPEVIETMPRTMTPARRLHQQRNTRPTVTGPAANLRQRNRL